MIPSIESHIKRLRKHPRVKKLIVRNDAVYITTNDIILTYEHGWKERRLNLGEFKIRLAVPWLGTKSRYLDLTDVIYIGRAKGVLPETTNDDIKYSHPQVENWVNEPGESYVCWAGYWHPLKEYIIQGDLEAIFETVLRFLESCSRDELSTLYHMGVVDKTFQPRPKYQLKEGSESIR